MAVPARGVDGSDARGGVGAGGRGSGSRAVGERGEAAQAELGRGVPVVVPAKPCRRLGIRPGGRHPQRPAGRGRTAVRTGGDWRERPRREAASPSPLSSCTMQGLQSPVIDEGVQIRGGSSCSATRSVNGKRLTTTSDVGAKARASPVSRDITWGASWSRVSRRPLASGARVWRWGVAASPLASRLLSLRIHIFPNDCYLSAPEDGSPRPRYFWAGRTNSEATSWCDPSNAQSIARSPLGFVATGSAPPLSNSLTTSISPSAAAHIRAVPLCLG